MKSFYALLSLLAIQSQLIHAQNQFPVLVKDINPTGDSEPEGFITLGDKIVFMADDGVHGKEPWISDGTEAGTVMIKDINPLGASFTFYSSIDGSAYFVRRNNDLFFCANDGTHGREVWVTDGTEAGTRMVKDIGDNNSSNIQKMMLFNDHVYFRAENENGEGTRMWVSDGTEQGTYQFADINVGGFSSAVTGNKLYFVADSIGYGNEVWSTDGTPEGTKIVVDLVPGQNSSSPDDIHAFENKIVFSADSGDTGEEPWITDGTTEGTFILKDIYPGTGFGGNSQPGNFIEFNGRMYFTAREDNQEEIWATDGTREGTVKVTHINPDESSTPLYLCIFQEKLWFIASSPEGRGIWNTDGTEAGTVQFMQIFASGLMPAGDRFFFVCNDGVGLWVSDGTVDNTHNLPPVGGNFQNIFYGFGQAGGQFFIGASYNAPGAELYKLDLIQQIAETPENEHGIVFPNPASEQVSIKNIPASNEQKVTITNLSGKIIIETSGALKNDKSFDVSVKELTPGTYILSTGNYSWKFIKN